MKKRIFALLVLTFAVFMLAACGQKKTYEVAVVTDVGQLNDGGFNQGTYEGAELFAKAKKKTYKYYQPANGNSATDNDRIAAMRQAIENGAKIIVTPGFMQETAIKTVAKESPEIKFVFVDGWQLDIDNVVAVSYREEESGFFAGYAAVKDGYKKLGGTFGGGGTNSACNRFAYGYVQGAQRAANELGIDDVSVKISFQNGSNFSASPQLKTQISGWYSSGVEIIFSCGGSMLQSVKSACEETTDGKIIGVDVDQAKESDRIVTSAIKGLRESVQQVLNIWNDGEWDAKLKNAKFVLGAKENSTGIPTAADSWRFKTFTVEQYNEIFKKVANGTLVPAIDGNTADNMNVASVWEAYDLLFTNITIQFE